MVSFESDYIAGAHPEIIKRLTETNIYRFPAMEAINIVKWPRKKSKRQ